MKKQLTLKILAIMVILIFGVGFVEAACSGGSFPSGNPCAKQQNTNEWTSCQNTARSQNSPCATPQQKTNYQQAMQKCKQDAVVRHAQALAGKGIAFSQACAEANACVKGMTNAPQMAAAVNSALGGQTCLGGKEAGDLAEGQNKEGGGGGGGGDTLSGMISALAAVAQAIVAFLNYFETVEQNDINNAREDRREAREVEDRLAQKQEQNPICNTEEGIGLDCPTAPTTQPAPGPVASLTTPTNFCTGDICQDVHQIPRGTNLVFSSIHMVFPVSKNYYALLEGPNDGIRYRNGIIYFDSRGTTRFSIVNPAGQVIQHPNGDILGLGRGTTYYYGRTQTYQTNGIILHAESLSGVVTTANRDGDEFSRSSQYISGASVGFRSSDLTTAISFDKFLLPSFPNAVDIGNSGDSTNILVKGYLNMFVAGQNGIFPFFSRGVAKGDSAITFDKGVSIARAYVVRDGTYNYLILPHEGSTKVVAANSKIIQDSAGIPMRLSARERALVYGDVSERTRPDLIFE